MSIAEDPEYTSPANRAAADAADDRATGSAGAVIDGLVAEFETPEAMLAACRSLRDAGYTRFESHSPFPVHGSDEAVGVKPTILPWFVLGAAFTGSAIALLMIWWMNAVDYPFQISAKPLFALAPSMPITFELTVLLAASTAFFSVFVLSNLPMFSNPLLRSRHFARATDDRFVVSVEAKDRLYGPDTADILRQHEPLAIEELSTPQTNEPFVPASLIVVGVLGGILSLVPFGLALNARTTTSEKTRIHLVQDMDQQPRLNAQQRSPIFTDGRAARPDVLGAVPRTEGSDDSEYYRGIRSGGDEAAGQDPTDGDVTQARRPLSADELALFDVGDGTDGASGPAAETDQAAVPVDDAAAEATAPEPDWVTEFPAAFEISDEVMAHGQERYKIYCSMCHGMGGHGNGLVHRRAQQIQASTWVQPSSFHTEAVRGRPVGHLYNTVANGIRRMPGYSAQIPVNDRWAIVLYLRALQASQLGEADDLDPEIVETLRANK